MLIAVMIVRRKTIILIMIVSLLTKLHLIRMKEMMMIAMTSVKVMMIWSIVMIIMGDNFFLFYNAPLLESL